MLGHNSAKCETGFLGTFKRSSFGLHWTEKQVFIRSSFYNLSMNTKTGHTAFRFTQKNQINIENFVTAKS